VNDTGGSGFVSQSAEHLFPFLYGDNRTGLVSPVRIRDAT
jgi:hypothetical protein